MERLKAENTAVEFHTAEEMNSFLNEMEETDERHELILNTIKTYGEDDELYLEATEVSGAQVKLPLWPFSITSSRSSSPTGTKRTIRGRGRKTK